ncbi:MAG: FAD-binding oxidoreductase [Promethearchaeota archaeon]
MTALLKKLKNVLSEKFISNSLIVRHAYSRNVDPILQGIPDVVIRPKDAEEVSEILKIANEENIPVIPRGGGDCEMGGSKPIGDGGIVLDMKRMNGVINLDQNNLVVTVEAGISWEKLNYYLEDYGLYTGCMGPGSGMTASIGGGISHHSVGGGGCAKYGACTNQLVSLEVVLPTGAIIETGSQANKFSKLPFNRFGNGPDLAGLFSGDNGIFGVKTKISLQVFPKPLFANYKTFMLHRKADKISSEIFFEIRKKGIDVYDAFYIMDINVALGCELGLYPMWKNLEKKKATFFYTVEANSGVELDEKVKQLDEIILNKKKTEELGQEISEGNIAKWHYAEKGHWQMYHNLWGMLPTWEPLTAECFVPINSYPEILKDIGQWDFECSDDFKKIEDITKMRPMSGSGPILLIDGNNVELTCGFNSFGTYWDGKIYKEIEEINIKLWKSLLERVTKHGAQYYMMGDIMSRVMVDIGAYTPEYYNFLTSLKKLIDPNCILSRGKFNFWGDNK